MKTLIEEHQSIPKSSLLSRIKNMVKIKNWLGNEKLVLKNSGYDIDIQNTKLAPIMTQGKLSIMKHAYRRQLWNVIKNNPIELTQLANKRIKIGDGWSDHILYSSIIYAMEQSK